MSIHDPLRPCPYCTHPISADWVDVGVGWIQCGPYHCPVCNASEIGPEYNKVVHRLTEEEKNTGFYKSEISPLANQHKGKLVSHKVAEVLYREKYFAENGNPYNAKVYK